jgi:hypothetical protein
LGNPNPQASNLALAVVLLVVVFLQAAFNAWQDFSTSRVMASIQDMLPADVVVLRDGVQTSLPAASLVPGDLVQVVMGQKVPADVKLIDVSGDLRFDRSVLTGEVRHDARARARSFLSFSANDSRCYRRVNRSQDAWKRRMTTSSRYVVSRPGFPPPPCVSFFLMFSPRQKTSLFKEHSASTDPASASSSKSATTPYCACCFPSHPEHECHTFMTPSGRIAKLSSAASSSMTTLQREIFRFVVIIASLATLLAIIIVILWAAW